MLRKPIARLLQADRTMFLVLAVLVILLTLRDQAREQNALPRNTPEEALPLDAVRAVFPDAVRLGHGGDPSTQGYLVLDESGKGLGRVFASSPLADDILGHGGPMPLLVGVDMNDRISGIHLLPNSETPAFLRYLEEEGLLDSWTGLSTDEAREKQVDAISGATMSSRALIATMRITLGNAASAEVLPQAAAPPAARRGAVFWACWLVVALSLIAFAAPRRMHRFRVLLQALNVAILGFWAGSALSLAGWWGWLRHGSWSLLLGPIFTMGVLAVVLPLVSGRDYYCTHLCPYGGLQDLVSAAWPWKRRCLPRWVGASLRVFRGGAMAVLFLLLFLSVPVDLAILEPFAAFKPALSPWISLVLAGLFVLLAFPFPRFWCRHLCPTGHLLRLCRARRSDPEMIAGRSAFFRLGFVLLALAGIVAAVSPSFRAPFAGATAGTEGAQAGEKSPAAAAERDILRVIHNRKSVRHYTGEPVSREQLDTLLRAGMAAPTAGNAQPWAFVVLRERGALERLAAGFEYGKMLRDAAAAIVVCAVPERGHRRLAEGIWVLDCAAATQNILLAAEGIGLGAVWVGCYPYEERIRLVRDVAELPDTVMPIAVVSLGHPGGSEEPKVKYKEENVHWERW